MHDLPGAPMWPGTKISRRGAAAEVWGCSRKKERASLSALSRQADAGRLLAPTILESTTAASLSRIRRKNQKIRNIQSVFCPSISFAASTYRRLEFAAW
jgi:hypothetical protein